MNWLGIRLPVLLVVLPSAAFGGGLFAWLLTRGIDAPYLVGIVVGVGAAAVSRERSGMRGVWCGVFSVWAGAIAQRLAGPYASVSLFGFASTLTWGRAALFSLGAALAAAVGSRGLRRPS